jgi:hypothetical protein
MPVIVAVAGTLKPGPDANNVCDEAPEAKVTVASADGATRLLEFVQAVPVALNTLTLLGLSGPSEVICPVMTEANPVGLKMLLGLDQSAPEAMLPMLGPTKIPVVETALPDNPFCGSTFGLFKAAVNMVMVRVSTYTVCPFKNDRFPVKPLSRNPSFTVGSGPA